MRSMTWPTYREPTSRLPTTWSMRSWPASRLNTSNLLATSTLDRFCAPLCECVLGSAADQDGSACDVPACMQWLERHNLFVTPLDSHRQWYRYHHLFQELLQRRLLSEAGPEQAAELHRRAAAWFAGSGFDRRSYSPRPGHQ